MTAKSQTSTTWTLLLILLSTSGISLADYTFYKGRTEYLLVTNAKTWDQAEADAVTKGGHLVQINDADENSLILSKISDKVTSTAGDGGGAKYCWIGGKETPTEGTYAWTGGATFWAGGTGGSAQGGNYQNWGRLSSPYGGPEPDNYGTQDRAAMALEKWPTIAVSGEQIGNAGQWNDISKNNTLYYLIERPISKPAEGLFAVFQMSHGGVSAGSFTCQLHYDKAPIAVANFISLVEGTRGWIDNPRGRISNTPYYNGLKFHRIIQNFMIQGGDPNGTGSGGPGYRFVDEFHPNLRHDHPGVLSMANSGKNTNGSQFFVTVTETPHLNDVHTIFGEVVEGYESCVLPLSNVPTGANDVPTQDVLITSVTIERLGASAQAFNPLNPALGLPVCSMHQTTLGCTPTGTMTMRWPEPAHCSYTLFDSPDLANWSGQSISYYSGFSPAVQQSLDVTEIPAPGAPRHFFNLAKATYFLLPPTFQNRRMVLTGSTYLTTIDITSETGGTHRIQNGASMDLNSTLSNAQWSASQYYVASFKSDINPPFIYLGHTLDHSDWVLTFHTPSSGSFTGGFYTTDRALVLRESGEFTITTL
jgi:cyclophilin family peptidyl-prolyl cis-trans isomerase